MEHVKTNHNLVNITLQHIMETFKDDKLILIDIFSFFTRLYIPNIKTKSIENTTLIIEPILSKLRNFPFIQSMIVYTLSEPEFHYEHLPLVSFVLYLKLVLPDFVFVSVEYTLWGRLREKHPNSHTRCFMDFYKSKPYLTTQLVHISSITGIPCNNLKVLLNGEIFEQIFVKRRSKITTKEILLNDMTRSLNIFEHRDSIIYSFLKELFVMFISNHKYKIDVAIKENNQQVTNDKTTYNSVLGKTHETGDTEINVQKLDLFIKTVTDMLKEEFGTYKQITTLTIYNIIKHYMDDIKQESSVLNKNERNIEFINDIYSYLFSIKDFGLIKLFDDATGFTKYGLNKVDNGLSNGYNKEPRKSDYRNKKEQEYVLNVIDKTKNKLLVFVTCFNIYKKPINNKVKINLLELLDGESKSLLEHLYTKDNYEVIKNGLERNIDDSLYQLKTAQVLVARLVLIKNSMI